MAGGAATAVLATVDRIGLIAGPGDRARMIEHVRATTRCEWMFWDAAWRQEAWPV
ncbi:MAG: hypothetical protein ACYCXA_15235 [Actinomycetes bacterium]